ncbi:MAG: hypothetical protein DMF63_04770 [Acidobacteria bacterium]|nr:MAG: hypothetical protein DMF63_04770 [Acidobacteriota bacterium]
MRILQISSARSIGGGERHVIDLSNQLARRGHNVFVAVVPRSPLRDELRDVPVENIVEVPLRNALDVPSALKLAQFIRENNVEMVNVHFAKDYPVAAIAARHAGVPFVITRHVLFPMSRLHRLVLSRVKYAIAPSNAAAESLLRQQIFPPEKIVTIRYGLDVDKFPERGPISREEFCIGSIGNLDPVKGFDVLIRAAAIVAKVKPEAKFTIVGEDRSRDKRNERELRDLIEELNLTETVELAGWSNNVADLLTGFDILVSASRSESFGFVIAEAMLTGVPVIATETEGAKEIISDPTHGKLVPIESPEAIADAILQLIGDDGQRAQIAASGRDYVHESFSLVRMVNQTEELYRLAIAAPI